MKMAGKKDDQSDDAMSVSEGECSASEEELNTTECKVCNMNFTSDSAFYTHIHSVSHAQKSMESSDGTVKSDLVNSVVGGDIPKPLDIFVAENISKIRHSVEKSADQLPLANTESVPHSSAPAMESSWEGNLLHTVSPTVKQSSILALAPQQRATTVGLHGHNSLLPELPAVRNVVNQPGVLPQVRPLMSINVAPVTAENSELPTAFQFEPLITGTWQMKQKPYSDAPVYLTCQLCSTVYDNRLMYELHMAGLRHRKNTPEAKKAIADPVVKKAKASGDREHNAGFFRHLDEMTEQPLPVARPLLPPPLPPPSPPPPASDTVTSSESGFPKLKISGILERNVGLLNQLVSQEPDIDALPEKHKPSPRATSPPKNVSPIETSKLRKLTQSVERNVNVLSCLCSPVAEDTGSSQPDSTSELEAKTPANASSSKDEVMEKAEPADSVSQSQGPEDAKQVIAVAQPPLPVLGADYLSEYRFVDGRVELTCDLCDIPLTVTDSVVQDHTNTPHHIQSYLLHHEPDAFRLMKEADKLYDHNVIQQVALAVERKYGRSLQARVWLEKDTLDTDGKKQWAEQKHEHVRAISALPGHCMNLDYAAHRPISKSAVAVSTVDDLLDKLGLMSSRARGRPPSLRSPVSVLDLITSVGKFQVKNDTDAEISLQIANTLTLGVLSYRMQMLPGLRPTDRAKYEGRLIKLHEDAELVAAKASVRELTADSSNVPTSAKPSGDKTEKMVTAAAAGT